MCEFVIRNLQIELSEFSKTKTVLTMTATLVDAIVRVVGELLARVLPLSVSSRAGVYTLYVWARLLLSAVFPNDAPVFCARPGNQPVSAV